MATEHKKEKRKIRKQKKREKRLNEEKKKLENKRLDICFLLRTELHDTKPNMAKFLDNHVKSIRLFICNNIDIYPEFHYDITKIFIKFKDGTEIMRFKGMTGYEYIMEYNLEEIPIKEKEKELINQFFSLLFQFKFIY